MNIWSYLARGARILVFSDEAIQDILEDERAGHNAVATLGVAAVLLSILAATIGFTLQSPLASIGGLFYGVMAAALALLGLAVIHAFAYLLGGHGIFNRLFVVAVSVGVWLMIGNAIVSIISADISQGDLLVMVWFAYSLSIITSMIHRVYRISHARAAIAAILGVATFNLLVQGGLFVLLFGGLSLLVPVL